jgi:hypothetical protein
VKRRGRLITAICSCGSLWGVIECAVCASPLATGAAPGPGEVPVTDRTGADRLHATRIDVVPSRTLTQQAILTEEDLKAVKLRDALLRPEDMQAVVVRPPLLTPEDMQAVVVRPARSGPGEPGPGHK